MRKKHPSVEAHEILPNLWQGSIPPAGRALKKAGFDILVLCAREHQYPARVYSGIHVIHAPNDDHSEMPLTREKLATAVQAARKVTKAIQAGKNCLVTCAAGMNRSGLVSALSLHLLTGWSGDKCIQQVRLKRGPHKDGFVPLSNDEFVVCLQQLKAKTGLPAAAVPPASGAE